MEYVPDELDYRIIHALQIDPRASWASLSPVIGAEAGTLGRRWKRIQKEGLAWTTALSVNMRDSGAILVVDCHPGTMHDVVLAFREMPQAITIDVGTGNMELVITVVEHDGESLARFLFEDLRTTPNIRSVQAYLTTQTWKNGEQWRLGSLAPDEVDAIPQAKPPRRRAAKSISPNIESAIFTLLGPDARVPAAKVAQAAGVSLQRAQDAIDVMRERGDIKLRTHVNRSVSGWPIHLWYFLDVQPSKLDHIGKTLSSMGEVRFVASVAGSHNLIVSVWLRRLVQAHTFERFMEEKFGVVNIAGRSVIMRTVKYMGHLLDASGQNQGVYVPMVTAVRARELEQGSHAGQVL